MINSHTNDEYLDDPKFWPILEAAEALDRCIYIHPRAACDGFKGPLQDYGMDSAMWGYGMETGTHAVRMMASRRVRPLPEAEDLPRPYGRGDPVLALAARLHEHAAPRRAAARRRPTLSMDEYFQAQLRDHHQRRRGSISRSIMRSTSSAWTM